MYINSGEMGTYYVFTLHTELARKPRGLPDKLDMTLETLLLLANVFNQISKYNYKLDGNTFL